MPRTDHYLIKYFESGHLPPRLRAISRKFHTLALEIDKELPNGPEKSAGLRKLLEAKDCAVRSALDLAEGTS